MGKTKSKEVVTAQVKQRPVYPDNKPSTTGKKSGCGRSNREVGSVSGVKGGRTADK